MRCGTIIKYQEDIKMGENPGRKDFYEHYCSDISI